MRPLFGHNMFKYNEMAFEEIIKISTSKNDKNLLAVTYCTLITIELILKRILNNSGGHDIPGMLIHTCKKHPKHQRTLTTYSKQLRNLLQNIYVQGLNNTCRLAPAESYPFIRYFRHHSDWPSPNHVELDVFKLLNSAKQIRAFLKKNF